MRITIALGVSLALAACGGRTVDLGGDDATPSGTDGGGGGGEGAVNDGSDASFFLQSVLAPNAGSCAFTASPSQPTRSGGILDVVAVEAFADAYEATFLAGDRNASSSLVTTEESRILIQGANVTITDASGNPIPGGTSSYTAPAAAVGLSVEPMIDPSTDGSVGYAAVRFEIVDQATILALKSALKNLGDHETIITHTQAFGTTLGGDHVQSNTFDFSIVACNGCLIQFDTDTSKEPQPNCYGPSPAHPAMACNFGQDDKFDCHVCSGTPYCTCGQSSCP